jgi:diguanylate cyclase (GGDEF)-like protein
LNYYSQDENIKSFFGYPIFYEDTLYGVLCLDSKEPDKFSNFEHIILSFCKLIEYYIKVNKHLKSLNTLKTEFENLYSATTHLSKTLKFEDIFKELNNQITTITNCDLVIILYKHKSDDDNIKIVEVSDRSFASYLGKAYNLSSDLTLLALAVKNKKSFYYNEINFPDSPIQIYNKILTNVSFNNYRQVFILPLIANEKVLGCSVILSKNGALERVSVRKTLEVLAHNAAILIQNAQLYKDMENMASLDGLTNLYNHRYFKSQLALKLLEASRYRQNVSLIIGDIDHFKDINDNYGHQIGDKILVNIANLLVKSVRGIDLIARYGGEEFAIVLPNTDYIGAIVIAERIRNELNNKNIVIEGNSFKITISFGISSYPFDANNLDELIKKADKALYFSKTHGRNKSILYREAFREQPEMTI